MNGLTLIVTYIAKPGMREAFLRALASRGIPDLIRAEEGCLQYDYYLSLQSPEEILLVEKWTSAQAQEVHLCQPHMAQLRELKDQFVERAEIWKLAEVD